MMYIFKILYYILFLLNITYKLFCLVITNLRETCSMKLQNKHTYIPQKITKYIQDETNLKAGKIVHKNT